LNSECLMKVADFGLARSVASLAKKDDENQEENPVLTDYVATRWYRAPEILLGSTTYTKGVDMWSVGCILGELLGGKPMFPGTSTMNQLDRILEITGTPTEEDIEAINSPFASTMLGTLNQVKPKDLREIFPKAPEDALDLLKKTLQFNPNKRITAADALKHEYVSKFHEPQNEPDAPAPIVIGIDDDKKLGINDYRNALYRDVINKKKSSSSSSGGSSKSEKSTATTSSSPTTASASPTTSAESKPAPSSTSTSSPSTATVASSTGARTSSSISDKEKKKIEKEAKKEEKRKKKEEKEKIKKEKTKKKEKEKK